MIPNLRILEKYLNLLLIFLFPTQLALHFWPDFALVLGIRVDYLSPAIYLTDVLFVILSIPWVIKERNILFKELVKFKKSLTLLLIIVVINLFTSSLFWISLVKWLKVIEMVFLAYYVRNRKNIFTFENVSKVLFISLALFSTIGVFQFLLGRTLGGILYWVGERSFSIFTPGIATVNLLGRNYLRLYSTFPHPNSFAGFMGVGFIFLTFNQFIKNKFLIMSGYLLMFAAFVLTFSVSAYVAILACIILYVVFKRKIINQKALTLFVILTFLASLYLTILSKPLLQTGISFSKSFSERLVLGNIAGEMLSENWVVGTGLNTFIVNEINYSDSENNIWLLQPVHNVYLLTMTEVGLLGTLLLLCLFFYLLANNVKSKNIWGILAIVYILVTGLFDHYWITLQQNMLLVALLLGMSLREK